MDTPQRSDIKENCGMFRDSLVGIKPHDFYLRYMCDVIPIKDIRHIYGPISYSEYHKDGQTLGIFGEMHFISNPVEIDKSNTLSVASLIKVLLETRPDRFYDFFLETPTPFVNVDGSRFAGITSFNHFFGDCLKVVKNCPYPNLRAHYIDYRIMIGPIFADFLPKFMSLVYEDRGEDDPYYERENLERVMQFTVERVLAFMASDVKLNKGLTTTPPTNPSIHEFIRDQILRVEKGYWYWIKTVKGPFSKFDKIRALNFILDIHSLLMDAYALGRMLKTFKVEEGGIQPARAMNCIVYTGDFHSTTYRDFLYKVGFDCTISTWSQPGSHLIDFNPYESALLLNSLNP